MVVHSLDIPCRAFAPFEAYAPLIVDTDAKLSAPIAMQSFKAIARRNPQIVEPFGRVEGEKLGPTPALNLIGQALNRVAGKKCCRSLIAEALDHACNAYRRTVRTSRPVLNRRWRKQSSTAAIYLGPAPYPSP